MVGGNMIEIQPVEIYPDDYDTLTKQAKRELQAGYKPPLKPGSEDMSNFDLILVGSPNWWSTVAPPVMTFLSACDLSGKKIAPFITHEGSGMGRSAADIAQLCPGANILDGLAVRGGRVNAVQGELTEWLRKLGMAV
jgi:flavodoxin